MKARLPRNKIVSVLAAQKILAMIVEHMQVALSTGDYSLTRCVMIELIIIYRNMAIEYP